MTSFTFDSERSFPDFALSHGLIDLDTYLNFSQNCPCVKPEREFVEYLGLKDYKTTCNITNDDDKNSNGFVSYKITKKCNEIRKQMSEQIKGLDIYGIYKKCKLNINNNNNNNNYKSFILKQLSKPKQKMFMDNLDSSESDSLENEFDIIKRRCDYNLSIEGFLNDEETKKKLYVNKTWQQCSNLSYPISNCFFFIKNILQKLRIKLKFGS